jgi:hypothetical protein
MISIPYGLSMSTIRQHAMDFWRIGVGCYGRLTQFPFATRILFRQDVSGERVAPFDFPGRRQFKALGSALMGF